MQASGQSQIAPTGQSQDQRIVQSSATFTILYPGYLPQDTYITSGRWWSSGAVVELHYRNDVFSTPLPGPITGPLTIKEWTNAALNELGAGRPGRNPDSQVVTAADGAPWWVFTDSDGLSIVEGIMGSLNIQLCSLFSPEDTLAIGESLHV